METNGMNSQNNLLREALEALATVERRSEYFQLSGANRVTAWGRF